MKEAEAAEIYFHVVAVEVEVYVEVAEYDVGFEFAAAEEGEYATFLSRILLKVKSASNCRLYYR